MRYHHVALALALASSSSSAQITDSTLNAELQRARDAFSQAYVGGEFAAIAAMYTPEAVLLPTDRVVRGRDAIQRYFTYGPGRAQVAHSMTPKSLTVEGRTAVEIGVWSSTVRRGDGPASTASGRHLLVWERQSDGRWLIAYDAWHQPPARYPEPQLVQDTVISAPDRHETWPSIDPIDGSLWFSVYDSSFDAQRLMRAPRAGDVWGPAAPVSFSSGAFGDRAARFSADGRRVSFTSNRPVAGHAAGDLDIWAAERTAGGWEVPRPLPAPVNSGARDMHASVADDGDLYLSSYREGGAGRNDVFRVARRGDGWGAAEPLPPEINDALGQPDLLVAPDASWMIVVVTNHPQGLGGDDLFLSRRTAHGWTPLEHFPAPINSAEYEYGPSLSPDGQWLLFTSHRRGTADVYRVPLRALGLDPAR